MTDSSTNDVNLRNDEATVDLFGPREEDQDAIRLFIKNVASELDGIRRSVTEENNSFLVKIDQLERERDQLKEQVEIYERDGCSCGKCSGNCDEIEKLNEEIYKKQLIILDLEKTVDKFNQTMKQFEQNIECLACENECLKNDKEKQNKNLECLQNELNEKIMENENNQEELENAKCCRDDSTISLNSLKWENDKLKKENSQIKMDLERTSKEMEAEKFELQRQIERLNEEQCKKSNAFRLKLDCAQQQYKELENQCTEKCFECAKLEEHLENSKKIVEDLTKMKQDLQCECNTLKEQNQESLEKQYAITQKMVNMQESCDKIKQQYTSKCLDCEDLKVKLDEEKELYDKCANDCKEMKKKLAENEKEMTCVSKRYNEIKEDCNQTCQELKKLKKQNEICCKQSQISRGEYNNLRREYKEIKKMLSDQIKRCKRDTGKTDAGQSCPNYCIIISDLKQQLYDRDKQVMNMQQKLKDSSYEIIELKDYIHKIVSDNNILKSAINSLISNLERKIKGPNLKSLQSSSAGAIAGEILQSLSTIENTIIRKSQGRCLPQGYSTKECNCLLQIQSQYVTNEVDQGTSNDCCLDYVMLKPVPCPNLNPCSTNPCTSHPSTNICSETSTTDSDECPRCKFLDNNSVELLEETIRGLKTSKNKTTKEKSCDCEQRCCDISTCSNN